MKTNISNTGLFSSKILPRNGCSKFWQILSLIAGLSILLATDLSAGNDSWCMAGQYQFTHPIGGLHNWFRSTPIAASLTLQKQTDERWFWGFRAEMIQYQRVNKEKLYYDDLKLALDMYGLCVQANYFLTGTRHRLESFITGSAGIYHWQSSRADYLLDEIYVPARDQTDWSWGFNFGPGFEARLTQHLAVAFWCQYQIIIAELWPALALRLENISGFQSVNSGIALKWSF